MKKGLAILVGMVLLLSIVAVAETQDSTGDALDKEVQSYESDNSGQADFQEVETEVQKSDAQIENELGISAEEKAEIDEATAKIGLKQYILNRQLKHRLFVALVHGKNVIRYLENKKYINDSTALEAKLQEINATYTALDPKTMTKEQFDAAIVKAKQLITDFRDAVDALLPVDAKLDIKNKIKEFDVKEKAKADDLAKLELKARLFYNRQKFIQAIKAVRDDVKDLQRDGGKLLGAGIRLKALNELRKRAENKNLTKEEIAQLKDKWKEDMKQFKEEKNASVVKNERAQLAISIADVRKAIKEAKASGQDTTALEAQMADLLNQLKDFVPGKVVSEEARAKAAVIKAKIANMENDSKIATRLKALRELRQGEGKRIPPEAKPGMPGRSPRPEGNPQARMPARQGDRGALDPSGNLGEEADSEGGN